MSTLEKSKKPRPTPKPRAINLKEIAFVEEYLVNGGSPEKAAIKAGYSAKSASQQGGNMLIYYPHVKDYLVKRKKEIADRMKKKTHLTLDYKLKKVYRIMEAFVPDEGTLVTDEVRAAMGAMAESNKMQGHLAAQKMEVTNLDEDEEIINGRNIINITQINLHAY